MDVDSGAWVEQRRSKEFDEVCTAIRTSFLGCSPDRWAHGPFGVDELEDRVEDELQEHVDFGGDAEFESELRPSWVLWNP